MSPTTSNRRLLVIGSQCQALGEGYRLKFLPWAAEELYTVLIDPDFGRCHPVQPDRGLMIDPTVAAVKTAIREAFRRASDDGSTLLLVFIGHGTYVGNDYFFLPLDAKSAPDPDTGIHLVQQIDYAYRAHPSIDGLVLLVDTCHSGLAAEQATQWVREYRRGEEAARKLRFEILTASAPDREAWDGCFTHTVTHCLRQGLDDVPTEELRCQDVERIVRRKCMPRQLPQFLAFTPSVPVVSDAGLWLARNAARSRPAWAGTWAGEEIARLTADFQPTPMLERAVAASGAHRSVALVGVAGTGKSTLAAALMRPEVGEGAVPAGFAHAVAFLSGGLSTSDLARMLVDQLDRAVPGFAAARKDYLGALTEDEQRRLDALQRDVLGPLRRLRPVKETVVRILVDGLDQVPSAGEVSIREALGELAAGPGLDHVRLICTARPDTDVPGGSHVLRVDKADDALLGAYLTRRRVAPGLHAAIVERAEGSWLVASKLADLALAAPGQAPDALPSSLGAIYAEYLRRAGATATDRWRRELRPVLGLLAAAGVGPILPLPLLCTASGRLGGPDRPYQVRDVLVDLRGLVVRDRAGTEDEQLGLFHQTLGGYLLDPASGPFGIDPQEPHRALAEAIAELAPAESHDPADPLHRYAAAREAEHLWALGEYGRVVESLAHRQSVIPAENLKRWQSWKARIESKLGPDHLETLRTRYNIAAWTGGAGDAREALRLFAELLPDRERVLGHDHPDTLRTRSNIATCTGEVGDAREALRLFAELLPDMERVLGRDHPTTLAIRNNIAGWTGETGDAPEALRLSRALLPDEERVLGRDHPTTLTTRNNIAAGTGEAGDAREALRLSSALLPDRERVLGRDHPDTLRTRNNIAAGTGDVGDARVALRLFAELLPDQQRVLGHDHPGTLTTRSNIAHWTGETGGAREALRLFTELLPDQERVLGRDHRGTLSTRNNIASWTGEVGDAREALRLFAELLPDMERVLGRDHPTTLTTRSNIAAWTGRVGDAREALRLFAELLPDRERVLGQDHPDTLTTRSNIAFWTGRVGDAREALRLFTELLPDQERVLGRDHTGTLTTRNNIAAWTGEVGEAREALRLFTELLPDQERVLGRDHPDTLRAQEAIKLLESAASLSQEGKGESSDLAH
jgi:hypothetical protein